MAVAYFDRAGLKALVTNPCVRNNAEAVTDVPWSWVHAGRCGNTAHDYQLSCSYRSSCRWPYRGKQVTETKGAAAANLTATVAPSIFPGGRQLVAGS